LVLTFSEIDNFAPFAFGTKAETLARIAPHLKQFVVPRSCYFTIGEWLLDPDAVLRDTARFFEEETIIVRSSARGEDGTEHSMAGQFLSVLNVPANCGAHLLEAIERVIASYARNEAAPNLEDQVLAQSMLSEVLMSGVLFTQDLNTGAPYYVINYDDETGRTDTVTSGGAYSNRTLVVHRGALDAVQSERFGELLAATVELEDVIPGQALDIEFAVDQELTVFLLQVRRMTTHLEPDIGMRGRVDEAIGRIQAFVTGRMAPMSGVHGRRSIFGQMPDWNPAEMIGRAPRPLALSLYRHLITDRAWRQARSQMGYDEPRGMPLLVSLGGQPYIDVRLSFHSLLPAGLDPGLAGKLINAWLDHLTDHPHLHDKVEFDVAITALSFDFDERLAIQCPGVLTAGEASSFREALAALTGALVRGEVTPMAGELAKIQQLADLRQSLVRQRPTDLAGVAALLEDCITLGTIPFSILARHAFIAQSLLRSLTARGVLSAGEADALMASVRTVAGELADDCRDLVAGTLSRADFQERYGHLRPGTYDIMSARYDQRDDLFTGAGPLAAPEPPAPFVPGAEQLRRIDGLLDEAGLGLTATTLFDYIREATAAREYAKFVFTRNLSDALEGIAAWGAGIGLSREELSYLDIGDILDTLVEINEGDVERHLRPRAVAGRQRHETTKALRLPQILTQALDVHVVPLRLSEPNFITHGSVSGHSVRLGGHTEVPANMAGAVVLIENADPGFDWIFAYAIAGLVTKYGGANSHMAIRCAEFGIPAAIGCGEQIFDRLSAARSIEINSAEKHVRPADGARR
jgi:phosphohistidine swiveling domain-containing protein